MLGLGNPVVCMFCVTSGKTNLKNLYVFPSLVLTRGVLQLSAPDFLENFRTASYRYGKIPKP